MPGMIEFLIALIATVLILLLPRLAKRKRAVVKNFFEHPENPLTKEMQGDEQRLMGATLYIHLSRDGRILILPGNTLVTEWVDIKRLELELQRVKREGGMVLYSRDNPEEEPSQTVTDTFEKVVSYKLPVKLMIEPHPDALNGIPPQSA
jgi:hypothetical protein